MCLTSLMILAIERNFIVNASAFRLSSLCPAFAPLARFFIVVSVIRVAKTFRRSPDMATLPRKLLYIHAPAPSPTRAPRQVPPAPPRQSFSHSLGTEACLPECESPRGTGRGSGRFRSDPVALSVDQERFSFCTDIGGSDGGSGQEVEERRARALALRACE